MYYCPFEGKYPVLPNLKSLALFNFSGTEKIALPVNHFISKSKVLVNLEFHNCLASGALAKEFPSRAVAQIKQIKIHNCLHPYFTANLIAHFPRLRHAICTPLPVLDKSEFADLVNKFLKSKVSKDLLSIQFRPSESKISSAPLTSFKRDWREAVIPKHWPKTKTGRLVNECINEPTSRILVLDFQLLLELARKYGVCKVLKD